MRQFILPICLFILGACTSNKEESTETAATSTTTAAASTESATVTYPVATGYSPTWEAGDHKNAIALLNLGNQWMAGNVDALGPSFADSVSLYFSDGTRFLGRRDSMIATMKAYRNMYSEIKSEVHNIVPLRHKDTKEDWVCIWLKEITVSKKGKKDSVELQENWRFNNEGKADLVYQYAATIKPLKK